MDNGTQTGVGALGQPNLSVQDSDAITNLAEKTRTGLDTLASPPGAPEQIQGELPLTPVSGGATMLQRMPPEQRSKFLSRFGKAVGNSLTSNPQAASTPGAIPRLLVGGALEALGGSLGDVGNIGQVPAGAGGLYGAAKVLQARGQRQMQQREMLSKEQTDTALRAETAARTAALVRNTYRQDQATRNDEYDRGSKFMGTLESEGHEVQKNITQDQLNQMIKDDPELWKKWVGRAVGEEPVFKGGKPVTDADGNPVMSPIYTLARTGAENMTKHQVTAAEATYYKNNLSANVPEGTELTLDQYANLNTRADASRASIKKIEQANKEDMDQSQQDQLRGELSDLNIQHYISMVPGSPLGGLYQAQKNAEDHIKAIAQNIQAVQSKVQTQPGQVNPVVQALQQKQQQFTDQLNKINHVINFGFNDKAKDDFIKQQDEQQKQAEVERHNRMDEQNKAAEIKAKKGDFQGDPNATTPEAFRASLDPAARSTVDLIGSGRAPLNNPSYLLARNPDIINAVTRAYPDFEPNKIKSYQENYTKYTSGKIGDQLKSGIVALDHLGEAFKLNTNASHILGTPAHTAYENKIDTLSAELAAFYGDSTVPAIAAIKETLMSTLPGNREAAIRTQAQSMLDRLDTFKSTWDESAPSKVYAAQMPAELSAMIARRNILNTLTGKQPAPQIGETKSFPNGRTGRWDGRGWVAQ